jgi:hypothetical protein
MMFQRKSTSCTYWSCFCSAQCYFNSFVHHQLDEAGFKWSAAKNYALFGLQEKNYTALHPLVGKTKIIGYSVERTGIVLEVMRIQLLYCFPDCLRSEKVILIKWSKNSTRSTLAPNLPPDDFDYPKSGLCIIFITPVKPLFMLEAINIKAGSLTFHERTGKL